MTLLDRFRAQARDKHSDPAVRLAFVDELPLDDPTTIAAIAREDEDPRVRKAAVAKLMAPAALATIAGDDRDDQVRAQALAMLRDIALEAFEELGEQASLDAVSRIVDPRTLAHVAKSATREAVALTALAGVRDLHVLGSLARHAAVEAVRRGALDKLTCPDGRADLIAVALRSDFKDTAVAAVDLLTEDRTALDQVIARGKNKSAVKRARAFLREVAEQEARDEAAAAGARIVVPVEAPPEMVESEPAELAPPSDLAAVASASIVDEVPAEKDPAEDDRRAEDAATAAARAQELAQSLEDARLAAEAESGRRHLRLTELADAAVAIAAEQDFSDARARFGSLRREWRLLAAGISVDPVLAQRFDVLDAQMTAREEEAREADARARRESLMQVHDLLRQIEPLADRADLSLKAGERALRDIRTALSSMPKLPTKQDFDDVSRRLKAAQTALMPRVAELRDADEWRRFANVSIQEQLCARMEALATAVNLDEASREIQQLQEQWRASADVPRAQADALWRRFKAAHDTAWARCEAHFAAEREARAANLASKIALCERAEAQAESIAWLQTADEIKRLQAEWKTIGPVSRGRERAIWERFRTACDRFFTRRHEDLKQRKASWAENLEKKDALAAQVEALAASTDWEPAAAEVRRLQAEWKTIGPVRKSKSDAVWHRFRSACDVFFARYAQRHDTARLERIAALETACAEIEALAAADSAPEGLAIAVRTLRGRWQELMSTAPGAVQASLDRRFGSAFTALLGRWPDAFAGTDLDLRENGKRLETLVQQVETLARSLSGPAPVDSSISPTNRLAMMLKEALAANTIGGKVDEETKLKAVAEEARQAQAAWSRIGLVDQGVLGPLADRFQRALRDIGGRTARIAQSSRTGSPAPAARAWQRDRPTRERQAGRPPNPSRSST